MTNNILYRSFLNENVRVLFSIMTASPSITKRMQFEFDIKGEAVRTRENKEEKSAICREKKMQLFCRIPNGTRGQSLL